MEKLKLRLQTNVVIIIKLPKAMILLNVYQRCTFQSTNAALLHVYRLVVLEQFSVNELNTMHLCQLIAYDCCW